MLPPYISKLPFFWTATPPPALSEWLPVMAPPYILKVALFWTATPLPKPLMVPAYRLNVP